MRKVLIWSVRVLGALFLAAFVFAAAAGGWVYWLASNELPDHSLVEGASSWYGCPSRTRRAEFVPLSAMPANAINAFLAAEEPDLLIREAYNPLTRLWRAKYRRPSPISIAYVDQLLFCLNRPASHHALRPFKEVLLHYRIERDLPRRSILETVINTAYFGRVADGMPAAALRYFQKPLTELSTGELAFLAGMRKSWRDFLHSDLTLKRRDAILLRNTILDRMAGMGALTAEQAVAAKLEPFNPQL